MKLPSVLKDWIVSWVVLKLKKKPFHIKTAIDYILLAFKVSGYLPEKMKALEIFGMYGLYVTRHYQHLCDYIELWEIDKDYVRYARKFKSRNMNVVEGDSIAAVKARRFSQRFDLLVVDNPLVSPFGGRFYEHFDVFPEILDAGKDDCLVLFNVILTTPETLYRHYGLNSAAHEEQRKEWEDRRRQFYQTDAKAIKPSGYVDLYKQKFESWGYSVQYSIFLPRNEFVGFLGIALRRLNTR